MTYCWVKFLKKYHIEHANKIVSYQPFRTTGWLFQNLQFSELKILTKKKMKDLIFFSLDTSCFDWKQTEIMPLFKQPKNIDSSFRLSWIQARLLYFDLFNFFFFALLLPLLIFFSVKRNFFRFCSHVNYLKFKASDRQIIIQTWYMLYSNNLERYYFEFQSISLNFFFSKKFLSSKRC